MCKAVLEGLARQASGITAENVLVDRRVAPTIDPLIHTEYADKFESYAYRNDLVSEAGTAVEGLLNDAGAPAHAVVVTRGRDSLG